MRMAKMVDIQDEYGNPIELTDEHGNPVVLTDEHGYPMRLTGVATKVGTTLGSLIHGGELSRGRGGGGEGGGGGGVVDTKAGSGGGYSDGEQELQPYEEHEEDGGSTSSFEEDDQTERVKKSKKKKGLAQKIIEKLTGGKHKEEQVQGSLMTTTIETASPTTIDQPIEHFKEDAMEKTGMKASNNDLDY